MVDNPSSLRLKSTIAWFERLASEKSRTVSSRFCTLRRYQRHALTGTSSRAEGHDGCDLLELSARDKEYLPVRSLGITGCIHSQFPVYSVVCPCYESVSLIRVLPSYRVLVYESMQSVRIPVSRLPCSVLRQRKAEKALRHNVRHDDVHDGLESSSHKLIIS